jgi:hypothetical protein
MWHVWQAGIQGKMFRVLAQMTDSPRTMVLHNGCMSQTYQPEMGWEQGDTLATTMFLIYVDAILKDVWQRCQGVPIPTSSQSLFDKLVALMYADDLVGVADTAEQLQTLADTLREALTRWRMKASVNATDGSKTAVMIVRPRRNHNAAQTQAHPLFTWGNITIPLVGSYKYLGVWMHETGKWDDHLSKRFDSANRAMRALYHTITAPKLPWTLRRMALNSLVMPVATYGAEIWFKSTQELCNKLDKWHMNQVTSAFHCPPNASRVCLQRELGLVPLHLTISKHLLTFWHRVQCMPDTWLTKVVANAWPDAFCPWRRGVTKLLAKLNIDPAQAIAKNEEGFKKMLKHKTAHQCLEIWEKSRGAHVLDRYEAAYGPAAKQDVGVTQPFVCELSNGMVKLGPVAELCVKLRTECLPLRGLGGSQPRSGESMIHFQQRRLCPCCSQGPETIAHFLFDCSKYQQHRTDLWTDLASTHDAKVQQLRNMQDENDKWHKMLDPCFWDTPASSSNFVAFKKVACFVMGIWKIRAATLLQ